MTKQHLSFLFISMAVMNMSCEEEDTHGDHAPELTITAPVNGSVLYAGDTLHIEWNATTEHDLHEALVVLDNVTNGTVAFSDTPVVHGLTSFSYNEHYVPDATAHSDFMLRVTVSDHEGNESTDSVSFHFMP